MAESLDQSLLQPDPDASPPPRLRFSEMGTSGLKVVNKRIIEEEDRAWRLPNRIKTVNEMVRDEYIAAALQFYTDTLAQVPHKVKPPKNATPEQVERAKFIEGMFDDMDKSFFSTKLDILTSIKYGFAPLEIVLKRRTPQTSRYKDGLVGVKALKLRAQSTITGWEVSDDGRDITGIIQSLSNLYYSERYANLATDGTNQVHIPMEKLLLFKTSSEGENPEGNPVLKNAYTAWKFKKEVAKSELIGISRDLGGLVVMRGPASAMSANATDAEKANYSAMCQMLRNIARGEQEGVYLPSDVGAEKNKLYDIDLMTSQGARSFDTNAVIARLNTAILVALSADILNVGNGATGSFALVEGKKGIVEFNLQFRLKEIADVFNTKLIPLIFKCNQWTDTELPTLEFGKISETSLDELSKAVQRMAAVSALEIDREVLNITRTAIGAEPHPDDDDPHTEHLNNSTSKSGAGMSEGMPSGTGSADGSSGDSSVSNNENT